MLWSAAKGFSPVLTQACRHMATSAGPAAKVGFIGLGHMGSRMIQRLLGAGHDLVVYDSNRLALSRAADLAKQQHSGSLEARPSPQDVSHDDDVGLIFTVLPSQDAVLKVYLGEDGLLKEKAAVKTSLFVDCSTVNPETARKLAKAAKHMKLAPNTLTYPGLNPDRPHLVDAPVSGGVLAAEAGTLNFMVGGHPAVVDALRPYLQAMGTHITYCGDHGTGSVAKLCNTLVQAASMAAVSETLALSRRLGLDHATMTDVLNNGTGRCWSSEHYNPVPGLLPDAPASKGYRPGLPTDMLNEQLQLLIGAAESANSPVPVAKHVKALYDRINDEGLGDKDFSSIFRYVYGQGCDNDEWQQGQQLFSSQIP